MFISITKSTENTEYLEGTPLLITKKINYEKKGVGECGEITTCT